MSCKSAWTTTRTPVMLKRTDNRAAAGDKANQNLVPAPIGLPSASKHPEQSST